MSTQQVAVPRNDFVLSIVAPQPQTPIDVPQKPVVSAYWGDPRFYEFDCVQWKFRCKLYNKFADDSHVQSDSCKRGNRLPPISFLS